MNEEEPERDIITYPKQNPESEAIIEDPGLLPDFTGKNMRDVLKRIKSLGLQVTLEGTGLAFRQTPEPGVPVDNITRVKVRFRPPM